MKEEVLEDLKDKVAKSHQAMKEELAKVRTGRANLSILDGIRVDYYGVSTPLNQVAALSVADPRLITIKPWDKSLIPAIERAINLSDLGLNPNNDGEAIRLPIPPLTVERRKDLSKMVRKKSEDYKTSMRNSRREANEMLKDMEKEKTLNEDDLHRALKDVQDIIDGGIKEVDRIAAQKEKEIMET